MPALFSLGLDSPLRSFAAELQPNERVLAFLDDIYVTSQPARTKPRSGMPAALSRPAFESWARMLGWGTPRGLLTNGGCASSVCLLALLSS